jgi:gliding motility-associated-like protein
MGNICNGRWVWSAKGLGMLLLVLFGGPHAWAQPLEVSSGPPYTPDNLITNVFLGDGVEVLSVTYEGNNQSVGFFNNGGGSIGMSRGIVMTTGRAATQGASIGVNSPGSSQASVSLPGTALFDPDMQAIAGQGGAINDICRYTITFKPVSDTLRFRYAFGSEEYPEYVCSNFNDIFGFFISGPGITGPYSNNSRNIALVPGTNLPVRINNVNSGVVGNNGTAGNCQPPLGSLNYSAFYNANENSPQLPVYDGYTDVFTAEAVVVPCSTYTIKLVICDVSDGAFDSGVFLEAKSFGTGSIDVQIAGLSVDGGLAEGCRSGEIAFVLPVRTEADLPISYSIEGSAQAGLDYSPLPAAVVIPAGDSIVRFTVEAFEDNIDEGDETIRLIVQVDPCNVDTFDIIIKENPLLKPDLGDDLQQCPDELVNLDGSIPIELPVPPLFINNTPLSIAQHNIQYFSPIEVQGVLPTTLGPEVIKSVCIDSLVHQWIDDLDIFLFSPDGQFIELTTDNGGNGGNGGQPDQYRRTCFSPTATTPINFPGPFAPASAVPFTGDWKPEGVWEDLWTGSRRTNGTWRLLITDDAMGFVGTLYQWSICFNAPYEINYQWTPASGLSCADCPDPVLTVPGTTTTYSLLAQDSYGCQVSDTLVVEPFGSLLMSDPVCGTVTEDSIEIIWPAVPASLGYELSIDGGPWIPANGVNSHLISGLSQLQTVTVAVRVIGSDCPSDPKLVSCTTLDCTPPAVSLATVNPVSCFGGSDGSVQLEVTAGNGPFVYALPGQQNTTGLFTGLSAGLGVAQVTDGSGCIASISFSVPQPPDPGFAFVVKKPVSCAGAQDAELTVVVDDGNGPYSFDWSTGATDSVATQLGTGQYLLNLTDAGGCIYRLDTLLSEPLPLQAAATVSEVSCFNGNNGAVQLIISGGTGEYAVEWLGSGGLFGPSIANIPAGSYEALIEDINGCSLSVRADVGQPQALEISAAATDAPCAGQPGGMLQASSEGGVLPYTYSWRETSSGTVIASAATANNVPAGAYTLLVGDANGCENTAQVIVAEPLPLAAVLSLRQPACFGSTDGQGDVLVSGGNAPYTYQWSNGAASQSTNTLAAGNVALTVTDVNGCQLDTVLLLSQPEHLLLSLNAYPVSCFGGSDGAVSSVVTGGTAPYTYNWNIAAAGTDSLSQLSAASVILQLSDTNGCEVADTIAIVEPSPLAVNFTVLDAACFGGDSGRITATATGGVGGYQYSWSNGQQTNIASGLQAGSYTLSLTDANGCALTETIAVSQPTLLTAAVSSSVQACSGPPNGGASVVAQGGTPPYNFNWSNGQSGSSIGGLSSGNYQLTVEDANGCRLILPVVIEIAPPVLLTYSVVDVDCHSSATGSVNLTVSGGTPPFIYQWGGAAIGNIPAATNLRAGSYTITVTDAQGCEASAAMVVAEPSPLQADAQLTNIACAGQSTGAISVSLTGGRQPYSYVWSNGETTASVDSLAAGQYSLLVRDGNGCQLSRSFSLLQPPAILLQPQITNADCANSSNGRIVISASGGQGPYIFQWSNGTNGASLEELTAGDYTVTLTDGLGCAVTRMYTVEAPPPIIVNLQTTDVSCFGEADGQLQVIASGGNPPYRFKINTSSLFSGSSLFLGLDEGNYAVLVRDAKGCEQQSGVANIRQPNPLLLDLPDRLIITYGDTTTLDPLISSDRPITFYSWTTVDTTRMSCTDCQQPLIYPVYEGDYALLIRDEEGCEARGSVRVIVEKNFRVDVPTGFTPNGDGQNDLLLVHGRPDIRVSLFRVYDRWGEIVFEAQDFDVNDTSVGWDGNFRTEPVNGGVFIWQVDALLPDGREQRFRGQTTLIR